MEQLTSFLREAKESGVYELYYIELATGLRRGELLGLKWARSKEAAAAHFEYEKQYSKFLKRLTLLESMKCFLEWVEQDVDF